MIQGTISCSTVLSTLCSSFACLCESRRQTVCAFRVHGSVMRYVDPCHQRETLGALFARSRRQIGATDESLVYLRIRFRCHLSSRRSRTQSQPERAHGPPMLLAKLVGRPTPLIDRLDGSFFKRQLRNNRPETVYLTYSSWIAFFAALVPLRSDGEPYSSDVSPGRPTNSRNSVDVFDCAFDFGASGCVSAEPPHG